MQNFPLLVFRAGDHRGRFVSDCTPETMHILLFFSDNDSQLFSFSIAQTNMQKKNYAIYSAVLSKIDVKNRVNIKLHDTLLYLRL